MIANGTADSFEYKAKAKQSSVRQRPNLSPGGCSSCHNAASVKKAARMSSSDLAQQTTSDTTGWTAKASAMKNDHRRASASVNVVFSCGNRSVSTANSI